LTKIRLTGFDQITPKVKLGITRAISEAKFEKTFRDLWVQQLQEKGFAEGLQPGTVTNRKRIAAFNETDPAYQPAKANLTLTGQLLKSLKGFFLGSKLVFSIRAGGRHKPYENAESSGRALLAAFEKRDKLGNARQLELKQFKKNRAAKQVKNSDIAKWQSDIFDFGQITRSPDFLIEITKRLKEVIIARYRN
jgi:hypothetical protein